MKIKHSNTPLGNIASSSNTVLSSNATANNATGFINYNTNTISSANSPFNQAENGDSNNQNQTSTTTYNIAPIPTRSTSANLLSGINEDSLSPTFTINQIQTRSAASRAAQQLQKSSFNNSSLKRHPQSHYSHHHNHQHIIGKIVKPIPVRPTSSSSSSSTHSSSFSTAAQQALNSNRNFLDSSDANNSTGQQNGNFSLIAKYFASFPATRLKAQSPVPANESNNLLFKLTHHNHHHHHNHNHQRHNNNPQASTPFLPFKKSHISKTSTFSPVVAASNSTNNPSYQQESTHHNEPEGIQFNLRSSSHNHHHNQNNFTLHNTDHLCTNFKRMIKLNDYNNSHSAVNNEDIAVGSPQTAASNTPTGLLDSDSGDHASSSVSNHSNGEHVSNSSNFRASSLNNKDGLLLDSSSSSTGIFSSSLNENSQPPIFGQITMETRSTRKFLIKHHPYLQMNNANMNNNVTHNKSHLNNCINKQQQMRPSINLIKMKKMIYNETPSSSSPVLNRNGRCGKSSNQDSSTVQWDHNGDQKLVKFTDIAPSPGYTTSLRIKNQQMINANAKRRQNNSNTQPAINKFQTPYTLKTRKSSTSSSSSNNANANISNSTPGSNKLENDWRNYNMNPNDLMLNDLEALCCYNENNDEEDIDDSQEDSSGYYSSYHSVDLISSSGGSSGGDLSKQNQSKVPVNMNMFGLNKSTAKTTVPTVETSINTPITDNNSNKPHHHYHTRYLTNYLQQNHSFSTNTDITSQRNRSTTPTVKQNPNTIASASTNNTPTTRLRYQQQLAAAAAATSSSNNIIKLKHQQQHHHQLEIDSACDLDLDQIEND